MLKKLFFIFVLLGFVCATCYEVFAKQPLIRPELKTDIRIMIFGFDGIGEEAIKDSAENWNKAAGREFIHITTDKPNLIIMPISVDPGAAGVTWPYIGDACLVLIHDEWRYNVPVITHEIGHCIGFGHDMDNKKSIMYWQISEKRGYDMKITKDLLKLLRDAFRQQAVTKEIPHT